MDVRSDSARADVRIESNFDFLSGEYRALYGRSGAAAFQHPVWLHALHARLAPKRGAEPVTVTVRDGGQLVAVLPLIRRVKTGVTLIEATDLGVSDYAAPVVSTDWVPDSHLAQRINASLPSFDLLRIRPITEEAVSSWQALLGGEIRELDFSAHATMLSGSFEDWRRNALDPSFAKQLDRKKKRFFKQPGAALRLLTDPGELVAAIHAIQTLRAGRFEGDPIQDEFVRDFYADAAVNGAAAGFARTYVLSLDGEPLGYVFGLTANGRFHYLLIGCDYDKHGRHSPGLLMYDGIIEHWMQAGGTVFDFTIGDEAFKADFGTRPTRMFILKATPTWRGKLASAAFDAREQLRKMNWGRRTDAKAAVKTGGENEA